MKRTEMIKGRIIFHKNHPDRYYRIVALNTRMKMGEAEWTDGVIYESISYSPFSFFVIPVEEMMKNFQLAKQ